MSSSALNASLSPKPTLQHIGSWIEESQAQKESAKIELIIEAGQNACDFQEIDMRDCTNRNQYYSPLQSWFQQPPRDDPWTIRNLYSEDTKYDLAQPAEVYKDSVSRVGAMQSEPIIVRRECTVRYVDDESCSLSLTLFSNSYLFWMHSY